MTLDLSLTPYTNINSKWTTDLKYKNIKLLDKNIRESLQNLGLQSNFRLDNKSMIQKGKLDKLDFIKIKNFCSVKDLLRE